MSYLVTRTGKGSALTSAEMDSNLSVLRAIPFCFSRFGAWTISTYFATGNGENTALGPVMPYAGIVTDITLGIDTLTSGQTATVEIYKNGVSTGTGYRLSITGDGSANKVTTLVLATPLSFSAGDRLNFYVITAPATAPGSANLMMLTRLYY